MAILPFIDTLREEDGLQSLETLVLTDVPCVCHVRAFTNWLLETEQNMSLLPRLSKVKLYYRPERNTKCCLDDPNDERSSEKLARVGIQVNE